ncbi:MAG: hypothetical protein QOC80_2202 [Frankiaceae bacterium]|nr:hypothetical protein [Frankiaceae bacterium]
MTDLRAVPDPDSAFDADAAAAAFAPEALEGLSLTAVERRLTTWAGRTAAGEARLLALLGEFDARCGWAGVGVRSCAHWATWRLGWSHTTAMEKVRVARALRSLPTIRGAFGAGRVSFSQVRALTRIATPANEHVFLELARVASAGQLEAIVGGIRRGACQLLCVRDRRFLIIFSDFDGGDELVAGRARPAFAEPSGEQVAVRAAPLEGALAAFDALVDGHLRSPWGAGRDMPARARSAPVSSPGWRRPRRAGRGLSVGPWGRLSRRRVPGTACPRCRGSRARAA